MLSYFSPAYRAGAAPWRRMRSRWTVRVSAGVCTDDDVRAISSALALCLFLWSLKVMLIGWYLFARRLNPLGDAPLLGILALGGADLMLCTLLAAAYRAAWTLSRRLPAVVGRFVRGPGVFGVHAALVVFSVFSFEVTRIYGWPLEVSHLRSVDDPRIISSSLLAYAGLFPLGLIALGLIAAPTLGSVLASALSRARWARRPWRLWAALLSATLVIASLWFTQLKGIDTYGVKDNAVVFFITHYKPRSTGVDARRMSAQLAQDVGPAENWLLAPRSIQLAAGTLRADYAAPAIGAARGFNLLLIQLESTSATYVDQETTPNLMRLAAHGLSFRNHATVFCETTRATYGIQYSDYLTDIGTTPRMLYGHTLPMSSLTEVAHRAGYRTAVFDSAFMNYADLIYLFRNQGTDTIVEAQDLWKGETLPWSWGVREEKGIDALCEWIGGHRDRPFLATYCTTFPHHPYVCPVDDKPFSETSWLNRYRNSLHYADKCLGRLIDQLGELNLLDDTLIAVVGDHGETVSSYPVGHGLALTREEVFTPFIISNPVLFPTPQVSDLTTDHLDVAPTLASVLGLDVPDEWLGRNLIAKQVPARLFFIQAKLAQVHGILDNGLIYVLEPARRRERLYDISGGGFAPLHDGDARAALAGRYRATDEAFQKWAVWRHFARASGVIDRAAAAANTAVPTTRPTHPPEASLLP